MAKAAPGAKVSDTTTHRGSQTGDNLKTIATGETPYKSTGIALNGHMYRRIRIDTDTITVQGNVGDVDKVSDSINEYIDINVIFGRGAVIIGDMDGESLKATIMALTR